MKARLQKHMRCLLMFHLLFQPKLEIYFTPLKHNANQGYSSANQDKRDRTSYYITLPRSQDH